MSERQVPVLLNPLVFLAHSVTKVEFSSWQVFGQYNVFCLLECAQKRVTDTDAENLILELPQ